MLISVRAFLSPQDVLEMLPGTDAAVTGAEWIRKDNVNDMAICIGCEDKLGVVHCATGPGD